MARWPKIPTGWKGFLRAEYVCSINLDSQLCGLAACAGSPYCSCDGANADWTARLGGSQWLNAQRRLLIGWLTDLEKRRDIRASKSSVRALPQVRTSETAQRHRLAVADWNFLSRQSRYIPQSADVIKVKNPA